jgi:hypothetical protein
VSSPRFWQKYVKYYVIFLPLLNKAKLLNIDHKFVKSSCDELTGNRKCKGFDFSLHHCLLTVHGDMYTSCPALSPDHFIHFTHALHLYLYTCFFSASSLCLKHIIFFGILPDTWKTCNKAIFQLTSNLKFDTISAMKKPTGWKTFIVVAIPKVYIFMMA